MKVQRFDDGERPDGLLFRFTGEIYNRPLGRGICLNDEEMTALEDVVPEGEYEAEIVIRRQGARRDFVENQP